MPVTGRVKNGPIRIRDPNTQKVQKNAIYWDKAKQPANFRGNPLYQATKRHLTVKRKNNNDEQISGLAFHLIIHRFSPFNCLNNSVVL